MRIISPAIHRVLDIVTVVGFALAPTVLHLTDTPAYLAYALAAVHLLMTVLTQFTATPARPIPLGLHGSVELVVGVALIALPLALGWAGTPRTFYLAAGVVILAVGVLSRYRTGDASAT